MSLVTVTILPSYLCVSTNCSVTFFYGWTALLTPSILCLINFVIVLSMKPVKSVDASQCSLFPVGDLSQMYFIWKLWLAHLLQAWSVVKLCTFFYAYLVNTSYIQIVAGIVLKIIAILVFGGGAPALLVFGMTSRIVFYRTRYEAYGFTASTYKNVYCISKSCFGKLIPGCAVPGFRRFFFALQPTGSGSYSLIQYLCSWYRFQR